MTSLVANTAEEKHTTALGATTEARPKFKQLGDLPNVEGFEFTGVRHDGVEVACVVCRHPISGPDHGTYYVAFRGDGCPCFSQLKGWLDEGATTEAHTPTPCRSFTDDPDAPGCCAGCGDAREAHCRVCGGAGHVYDVLGHGPWDCWECRPKRDEATKADPLSEDSLQAIICSPNFRDYEKVMARELLSSRNSFDALTEELAIVQRQRSDLARDLTRVITELDALTEANARYLAALQRIASTSIDCITRDTARSAIKGAK